MPNDVVDEEITSGQAMRLLGFKTQSQVRDLVMAGKLTPVRKVPGRNGARLFLRSDVQLIADERAAKLREQIESMETAKAESVAS